MSRIYSSKKLSSTDVPLFLFMLSAILALIPAYDRALAWPSLAALWIGGLLYWLISRLGKSGIIAPITLARIAAVMAGLAALYLVVQYSHDPELDKVAVISHLTAWIGQFTPQFSLWTPQANSMATLLEGMLFLSAGVLFLEKRTGWRFFWGALVFMIALILLISESRGAWLAIFLASVVWLAVYFRWARWLAALIGLGGVVLVFLVLFSGDITVLNRIPLVDRTLAPLFIRPDRLDVYRGSVYLIQDMPFSGIGLGGQFAMVYSQYVLLIKVPYLTYSHNLFIETWLELGLTGILSFIWLFAGLIWQAASVARHQHDLLYESTWMGLLAMALHGLTDARPYVDLWCWLPFFLLLGLNAGIWLSRQYPISSPRLIASPVGLTGFALLLCVVVIPLKPGVWEANQAGIQQIRADLAPDLDDAQRAELVDAATNQYQQSIALSTDQRTAHLRLGLIYTDQRQYLKAVDELELAYAFDPTNPVTQKALGLAYTWRGYLVRAKNLLVSVPGITDELNTWGKWWEEENRVDLSRRAYQVSLMIDPNQPTIIKSLGDLFAFH